MFCGRIAEPRDFRFHLDAATGSASGYTDTIPMGWDDTLEVQFADDYLLVHVGLKMSSVQVVGGANPSGGAEFYSDFFLASAGHYDPGGAAMDADFYWRGVRQYMMASGTWRTSWDSAEFKAGGATYWATGPGTYDTPVQPSPASVGLMGTYPRIEAHVLCPEVPSTTAGGGYSPPDMGSIDFAATSSGSGSWSFDAGSGWVMGGSASASASRTTHADASSATNHPTARWEYAVPSWSKKVIRMEAGTGAMVLRWGFPDLYQGHTDQTTTFGPIPPPPAVYPTIVGGTTYTPIKTGRTQLLRIVGDGTDLIEQPFTDAVPRPFYQSDLTETLTNSPENRVVVTHEDFFGGTTDDLYNDGHWDACVRPGQCAPFLDHYSGAFRLHNTWFHPHWSFGLYEADDTAFDADELLQRSQQHMVDATLTGTGPGRLTNVVAEGLDQNGITGLARVSIGCPCWWGIGSYGIEVRAPVIPSSLVLDARTDGRWTFAGDGSVGSSGTGSVTGTDVQGDAGNTAFDFALGHYTIWPFQTSHLADRLGISLTGSINVAKLEAFLIGVDGKAVKIGEATDSQPMRLPRGQNAKWWTSAGQAFPSDTYVPVAPSSKDASPNVALDAETATAMSFVGFGAGARIRFVVTPTNPALGVHFAYPTLYTGVRPENTSVARPDAASLVILQTDGPAIRYGEEGHYDGVTDSIVPAGIVPQPFDRRMELGDLYVWLNLWTQALGYDDGLDAWLAATYEFGVEYTLRLHAWRDPFDRSRVTHSFLVGGTSNVVGIGVQSYRAAPPCGYFPIKERTKASNWVNTGGYVQASYTLCQPRQWHLTTTGDGKGLYRSGDVLTYVSLVTGWRTGYHEIPVDASEGYDYEIHSPPTLAKVKPYHGIVWDGFYQAILRAGGWIAQSKRGQLHIATVEDGDVRYRRAKFTTPETGWHDDGTVTAFGDVALARMAIQESTRRIYMAVSRGSTAPYDLYLLKSESDGMDFDSGVLIATGTMLGTPWGEPTQAVGTTWFEYDSGTSGPGVQKAIYKPFGSETFGSPFVFNDATGTPIPVAENGGSNVAYAHDGQRRLVWSPIVDGETSESVWYSTDDARTWTRVI